MTIKVIHENGEQGKTYPRRAKQLVLKDRAVWAGEHTILMKKEKPVETTLNMEHPGTAIEIPIVAETAIEIPTVAQTETSKEIMPDQLLMYIAKQNVADKRNLVVNLLALPAVFLLLIIVSDSNLHNMQLLLGAYLGWLGYTIYRVILRLPNYFQRLTKKDPVQEEFERLKKQAEI